MNQAEALSNNSNIDSKKNPPYKLYAAVIGLIVVTRLLDLATQHMNWTVWIYGSTWCWILLGLVALVIGFFAAPRLRQRTPAIMAILICGLLGGVTNIVTNSSVGMVLGLVGATLSVVGPLRSFADRGLQRVVMPTFLVGAVSGVTAAMAWVLIQPRSQWSDRLCLLGPLLLGAVAIFVWSRWLRSKDEPSSWSRAFVGLVLTWPLKFLLYFVASTAVFLLTLNWELERRDRAMESVDTYVGYTEILSQYAPATLFGQQAFRAVEATLMGFHRAYLDFGAGTDSKDIRQAVGFPCLMDITIRKGSRITDEDFAKLDTRYLNSLNVFEGTELTSESVKSLDLSRFRSIGLYGPNFDDSAIANLSNASQLWQLELRGTKVTSAGLNINPLCPLMYVDLSRSQVDDAIVPVLAKLATQSLRLRGTKITGATLKSLRGLKLGLLDLSDTPGLETKYLADLIAPDGKKPNFNNQVFINTLDLANLQLSADDLDVVSQMSTLQRLTISGSQVSHESLDKLMKLPSLRALAIDADQLSEEALLAMPRSLELNLAFDEEDSLEEIQAMVADCKQLRLDSVNVIIGGFEVTEESTRKMLPLLGRAFQITFRNAKLPDGNTRDFSHFSQFVEYAKEHFPGVVAK